MKPLLIIGITLFLCGASAWSQDTLTLADCQQLALENHPVLKPFGYELRAQDGVIEQAGLRPNPELDIEAENILGTGAFQGVDGIETTAAVRQVFETAGKPQKRVIAAQREKEWLNGAFNAAQLETLYNTTAAFIDVLSTQEQLELEKAFFETSQQIHNAIRASVEAGRDSPVEETRARVMLSSTQINLDRTKRALQRNRLALAAQWTDQEPPFSRVEGSLLPIPVVSGVEKDVENVSRHPALMQADAEIAHQNAVLDVEKANATPDFELSAGLRYLSEDDDGAFMIGFSIPLPLRNRNQGAIRAAGERVGKTGAERDALLHQLRTDLRQSYQDYRQAAEETARLQDEILPSAQSAFEAMREGYRQGKFPYINVLDAQRTLYELRIQLLEVAATAHKAYNEINRLTANYDLLHHEKKENTP